MIDPKALPPVAVLSGGPSGEREVSLESGRNVLRALEGLGVNAVDIDVEPARIGEQLRNAKTPLVFNIVHGAFGEDGVLQGCLEAAGLAYTGSDLLATALAMDKWRSKQIWRDGGLPTPPALLLRRGETVPDVVAQLGLPLFVKPNCQGSSLGVAKVKTAEALYGALAAAFVYDEEVIVEKAITGQETTVAILNGLALPAIVIETPREFYDYEAKYLADNTRYLLPSGLPEAVENRLGTLALEAFRQLGGRDWGRIDFIVDGAQRPWILEMNSVPGMTSHSLVPMAAKAVGIDFPALCLAILEGAHRRMGTW